MPGRSGETIFDQRRQPLTLLRLLKSGGAGSVFTLQERPREVAKLYHSAKDAPLYFLCRSGIRSKAAAIAMAEAGFTACFNVAGGFEGPPDDRGHRGGSSGWKAEGLPWRQS